MDTASLSQSLKNSCWLFSVQSLIKTFRPNMCLQILWESVRIRWPACFDVLHTVLMKWYVCGVASYSDETWTLRKIDQKYFESFEMWCWKTKEMIILTDRVKHEEVLYRVNEEMSILRTRKWRKTNWIGHTFRWNRLLKNVIEEKVGEKEKTWKKT